MRTLLLRVLFWSLALAAVFGAMGVLFAQSTAIWRVAGTSIATSAAALLLLWSSLHLEKERARRAALLAVTLVVVEYLLTLAAIWNLEEFFGRPSEWRLWLTIFFIALVAIPAVAFARMLEIRLTRIAAWVGLALCAVELLLLLLGTWASWQRDTLFGELAGWLALFGFLAVVCLIGAGTGDRRLWRWIGVAAAAFGFALGAYASVKRIYGDGDIMVYVVSVAAAVAHANIVLLCPLRAGQMWLRWLTIAAGVATAFFVDLSIYFERDSELPQRLSAASAIVAGCGTLALAVLARLNRRVLPAGTPLSDLRDVTIVCPLCGKKQALALGGARCAGCNLIISVRVDEPRCAACGYSLLMLRSAVCPECGAPVPAGDAAAGDATAVLST